MHMKQPRLVEAHLGSLRLQSAHTSSKQASASCSLGAEGEWYLAVRRFEHRLEDLSMLGCLSLALSIPRRHLDTSMLGQSLPGAS